MKQKDFEHTLKQLTDDFSLPVSNGMFDAVLAKRRARRRKFLVWACGSVMVAVFSVCAVFYAGRQPGNTGLAVGKSADGPAETPAVLHNDAAEAPVPVVRKKAPYTQTRENKPDQQTPAVSAPSSGDAVKITGERAGTETARQATARRLFQPEKKQVAAAEKKKALPLRHVAASPENSTLAASRQHKESETRQQQVATGNAAVAKPETNENITDTSGRVITGVTQDAAPDGKRTGDELAKEVKPEEKPAAETDSLPVPADALSAAPQPLPGASVQKAGFKRWSVGVYGDFTPVSSVKNSNAVLPLPSDSLGLSDKMDHAFSAGIRFGFSFSEKWKLSVGLGYNKVQFDKIRISPVVIDTNKFESVTNGNLKSVEFSYNLSDHSFSWLQVPVSVSYTATPKKRVSFYSEAGFVYQSLLGSKGYELTTSDAGHLDYRPVSDRENSRIVRNQFAWFVEPGIQVHVTRRIRYQLGIVYRRHVTPLYHKSYSGGAAAYGPAYYLGASSSFSFIF